MENSENTILSNGNNSQCESCGGNLVFNPNFQKLWCANCQNQYDIPKVVQLVKLPIESATEDISSVDNWKTQNKVFRCKTCGASVILQGLDVTSKCPYCGSDYVLDPNTLPGLKPNTVIPFSFDEKKASEHFRNGVKKIFLIPNSFKKKVPENRIRGIYVPSFAFDSNTNSSYNGVLVKDHTHTNSKGQTTTTHEYIRIAGNKLLNFTNVTIESSSKIDNKDMKALLPYQLNFNYQFNNDFIRGYSTEHYCDSIDKCFEVAQQEMKTQIKQNILNEYRTRYHYDRVQSFNLSTTFNNNLYEYRLLPVYCFEFTYKNKKYITYMNGQTGKIGTGYPKAYWKIVVIVLSILVAFGLVFLLYLLSN